MGASMDITATMLRAARAAEFDHHRRNRGPHDRFRPMSDGLMRAIIDAAISAIGEDEEPEPEPPLISIAAIESDGLTHTCCLRASLPYFQHDCA
jgi:hypothetical protein